MTPTIKSFTCTSTLPYDRHYYTVNDKRFDSYEQLRAWWFQQGNIHGATVIVQDYTTKKRVSGGQGF